MVAAGVYLVGRVFVLMTPEAMLIIATIGALTLTMAALIAIVQTDIKRVLAYSTLSQLGYMIFAMGIGAWIAALFHLITHAFFKAMLFLGSGQVIEGCHHEQDMSKMGGLWRKMPGTAATFFVAVLAISGAGIPYFGPGIGGFYSKDEILAVAHFRRYDWSPEAAAAHAHASMASSMMIDTAQEEGHQEPDSGEAAGHEGAAAEQGGESHAASGGGHGQAEEGPDYFGMYSDVKPLSNVLYLLPILVAYITPFYMGRCFMLTFMGKPRDQHIHDHAHESPVMVWPLIILAVMTLVSGPVLFRGMIAGTAPATPPLVPMIDAGHGTAVSHAVHGALAMRVGFAFIVGLGLAYLMYRNGFAVAARLVKLPVVGACYNVLWNKFYFDHVYNFLLVGGTRVLAVICGIFDNWIIDGIVNAAGRSTTGVAIFTGEYLDNRGVDGAVNGTGKLAWTVGGALRSTHSGLIRNYILFAAILVSGLLISLYSVSLAVLFVLLGATLVASPTFFRNVAVPLFVVALLIRVGRIVLNGFAASGDVSGWRWNELSDFWRTYVAGSAGVVELAVLLILFGILYMRHSSLEKRRPAYSTA
jgi:NADH-quinone oxidoreductase subunit L